MSKEKVIDPTKIVLKGDTYTDFMLIRVSRDGFGEHLGTFDTLKDARVAAKATKIKSIIVKNVSKMVK